MFNGQTQHDAIQSVCTELVIVAEELEDAGQDAEAKECRAVALAVHRREVSVLAGVRLVGKFEDMIG